MSLAGKGAGAIWHDIEPEARAEFFCRILAASSRGASADCNRSA